MSNFFNWFGALIIYNNNLTNIKLSLFCIIINHFWDVITSYFNLWFFIFLLIRKKRILVFKRLPQNTTNFVHSERNTKKGSLFYKIHWIAVKSLK